MRLTAVVAGLLLFLSLCGCGSWQAHQLQRHAEQGDDAWIAAQAVKCTTASHACARQHLIKGQACLRLAEREDGAANYFTCAADGLAKGIALETSWENKDEQIGLHEALCKALDGLLQSQSEADDGEIRDQLLAAAQNLYQLTPGSISAQYFLSLAWLRLLEPRIDAIDAADRLPVCSRLKRTVNRILLVMETAKNEPPAQWNRFEASYQRLVFELGVAMRAAGCR